MSTMRFDYLSKLGIDPIFPAGDITIFISILARDIDIANLSVCLSVCLSVRPLRYGTIRKRLNISSDFFHYTVAQSF